MVEGDEGFEGALDYFPNTFTPKKIQPEYSGENGLWRYVVAIVICGIYSDYVYVCTTGKMQVLDYILAMTRSTTDDRVCVHMCLI